MQRAIIIDGGTDSGKTKAKDRIENSIKYIRKKYTKPWKFDAWVVTHWDADHYYGMLDCLTSDGFREKNFSVSAELYCGAAPPKTKTSAKHPLKGKFYDDFLVSRHSIVTYAHQYLFCSGFDSKMVAGEDLLGIDLFTGDSVLNVPIGILDKYNPELSEHVSKDKSIPRFCVLGAGGYGIGFKNPFVSAGKVTANQTPILAMLFWPENRKCSYFTGSDGFPKVEHDAIGGLLKSGKVMKKPVHVIKLDHHGSSHELLPQPQPQPQISDKPIQNLSIRNEFDKDIVTLLEPKSIIVTPGQCYGHPSTYFMSTDNLLIDGLTFDRLVCDRIPDQLFLPQETQQSVVYHTFPLLDDYKISSKKRSKCPEI